MNIKKWITTAAAAMLIVTCARADDSWLNTRLCYDTTGGMIFNANEFSLDLFGTYVAGERHFLAWPNTSIRHGLWGGGVGGNYFFTRYTGFGVDTAFIDGTSHFVDHVGGNIIFRIPIDPVHLAPYAFGGGGYGWNPDKRYFADVGVGLEFRLNPKVGIFGDARYIWREGTAPDECEIRAGLRMVF